MTVTGSPTSIMVTENYFIEMGPSTMEIGSKEKHMAKERSLIKPVTPIKVHGKITFEREPARKFGSTGRDMKESTERGKSAAEEKSNGLTDRTMTANGKTILIKVKASTVGIQRAS